MEQIEPTSVIGSIVKRTGQRSRKEVFDIMEKFEKSQNVSPTKFAEIHKISKATFYNWQKKYKSKDADKIDPKGFIPVSIAPEKIDDSQPGIFAEVNGKAIKIYQWVEPSYLKKLLS
jgi:transposase